MRLRYGREVFPFALESAVEAYFASLPCVQSASANHSTGSVLLQYGGNGRNQLLAAAENLRFSALVPLQNEENDSLRLIDETFKRELLSIVGWHLFCTFLLPSPIRKIITLWRSLHFFKKGLGSLKSGKIGVEVLDASAVGVSVLQGNFGTASSIMFLLGLSETLENYTLKKTKSMLSYSLLVHTNTVWVEQDGETRQIPMSDLRVGDLVVVRTGATIPVDGRVLKGEAVVNQAAMTGEPLGVFKKAEDSVFAGTVVEDGAITIKVSALEGDTRVSQIVDLISESEDLKASIQGKAERIADSIVPFSFLLAIGVFAFTQNLTKALSVLLVDYSCAIKLATPISVISAIREASTHRIVVKGGKFFEAIAEADAIIFDKTGTLTVAQPTVSKVVPMGEYTRDEVLRLAACMEEHFPHSVARAVVRAAQEENLRHEEQHTEVEYIVAHGIATTIHGQKAIIGSHHEENLRHEEQHTEVEYIVAHGIATTIHGQKAIIGSHHFVFEDEGTPLSEEQQTLMENQIGGDSAIYLAVGGKLAGFVCINDPPRPEAAATIARLRQLGIKEVIMLTGDSESAAKVVSQQLGIDRYQAQILPQDKAAIVKAIKAEGRKVIMVGDGINDSPALAAADVSVSMKDSSDIAREVADITLLDSDLSQLVTTRLLGQKLMQRIQHNFNFIVAFNTALLAIGIGNVITPGTSALLHNLSTIGISAASMRPCLPAAQPSAGATSQDALAAPLLPSPS